MKKFVIEFNKDWLSKHSGDIKAPVEVLKEAFVNVCGVEIKDSTTTTLTLHYDERFADYIGIKSNVIRFLRAKYRGETIKEKHTVSFISGDIPQDEEEIEKRRKELLEHLENIFNDDNKDDEDYFEKQFAALEREIAENIEKERKEEEEDRVESSNKPQKTLDKIDALVGASEFKEMAREIVSVADEVNRTNTFDVLANQCYLFSIGDGYGLSTYLDLLAEIMWTKRLCSLASTPVREVILEPYRESDEPFANVSRVLGTGVKDKVRILCIDISEWMNYTGNSYFKKFLRAIENHLGEFIVVFRIPFVDKDILSRIRHSISDVLSVKAISFPPFSQDEIKRCAKEQLKKYNFVMEDDAWEYFNERIYQEKSDGKFYGINTVTKVVKELVYQTLLTNSQRLIKSEQITVDEAKALCGETNDVNMSGEEMLNKLIGVESIKKRVEEIMAQIQLAMQDGSQRPCIHMRFVGNPGTGKTTVARIIGKMLKEKGVLRIGAFFEYAGRDFCGRYIGETAPKTSSICRDAYGSVLFIDEAYTLYRGDDNTKDFGKEAIDTLIAEMENHRNDLVVIMAGYRDDMDNLMKGNLGLASRMPYTIEFPNFTREQLSDIFISMVKGKFKYDEGLLNAAREFFGNLPDEILSAKDFANARYVRNLFERTWAKSAMRCQLDGNSEIMLTGDDFKLASADKEFVSKISKKTRMGF